ncbi:hypothetical protein MmiEs2_00400 [Methanimicrococcus stummii]|uniref:Uncharacterized protein n=1 Tax=Methanimicrococcus stummii TaxID=3028294 RepID=A0AA96V716_9EURY|nr:hypothetical protein MmiEs2_00400 [Methanimicrococcus sp. Es2]
MLRAFRYAIQEIGSFFELSFLFLFLLSDVSADIECVFVVDFCAVSCFKSKLIAFEKVFFKHFYHLFEPFSKGAVGCCFCLTFCFIYDTCAFSMNANIRFLIILILFL